MKTIRKALIPAVVLIVVLAVLRCRIPPYLEIPDPVKRPICCPSVAPSEDMRGVVRLTRGSWDAWGPSVSAEGRFVAFWYGVFERGWDVFVHDRRTGRTEKLTVASDGGEADGLSIYSSISADGRFVAFWSQATNLVPGDTNGVCDVFVRDLERGLTERASVGSSGTEGDEDSGGSVSLSARGRFVAFISGATNLVPGDTNGESDVFVRDHKTGQTTRVSVGSSGEQANGESAFSEISADGRFVAFCSDASNLVPGDANGRRDVFVHDRESGRTARIDSGPSDYEADIVSISTDGRFVAFGCGTGGLGPDDPGYNWKILVHDRATGQAKEVTGPWPKGSAGYCVQAPSISADGRFLAFKAGGLNYSHWQIYVRDLESGKTAVISCDSSGNRANGMTGSPAISADGRFVVFETQATNLVPDDTNDKSDVFIARNPLAPEPPAEALDAATPAR